MENETYEALETLISFPVGFNFTNYIDDEKNLLIPAMEQEGYTVITFFDIEKDSFGPLVRGVKFTDTLGTKRQASYG